MIAAGSDSQIWAQTFERSMGDTLALQADVARAIAEGVRAVLTPTERRRLKQARPTTPAANEAYFEGLHYLSQSSADGQRAVDAFRRATTLDPDHAGAHAVSPEGFSRWGSSEPSRMRKRARSRSRKPTGRWRSIPSRPKPLPPWQICVSTTTGTGPGPITRIGAPSSSIRAFRGPARSTHAIWLRPAAGKSRSRRRLGPQSSIRCRPAPRRRLR